jgi:hypothetical protein
MGSFPVNFPALGTDFKSVLGCKNIRRNFPHQVIFFTWNQQQVASQAPAQQISEWIDGKCLNNLPKLVRIVVSNNQKGIVTVDFPLKIKGNRSCRTIAFCP